MQEQDSSCVLHISRLDDQSRINFRPDRPWLFETDDAVMAFETEEAACAAQRAYREAGGFDPMTGEQLSGPVDGARAGLIEALGGARAKPE